MGVLGVALGELAISQGRGKSEPPIAFGREIEHVDDSAGVERSLDVWILVDLALKSNLGSNPRAVDAKQDQSALALEPAVRHNGHLPGQRAVDEPFRVERAGGVGSVFQSLLPLSAGGDVQDQVRHAFSPT